MTREWGRPPRYRRRVAAVPDAGSGTYQALQVIDRTGTRLALDEEVMPVTAAAGESSWALTDAAIRAGDRRLTQFFSTLLDPRR
jgi:hypothetical protein